MTHVLILGLGRIGTVWCRLCHEHPDIAVVTTVDPHAEEASCCELTDALLDAADLVLVCSPTATHSEYTLRALVAGKTVLCEQPLATSMADIVACFDAQQRQHQLIVALNRRWDPRIYEARRTAGKPLCVSIDCRDNPALLPKVPERSNGLYHDCLVHELDVLRWAFGVGGLRVDMVHEHMADNGYAAGVTADTLSSATVLLSSADRTCRAAVRFCRQSDRYVHSVRAKQVTTDASHTSVLIEVPMPPGSTFMDRFAESYKQLLQTAVRATQNRLTIQDRARIPSKHSCSRLLELCAEIHALAALGRS